MKRVGICHIVKGLIIAGPVGGEFRSSFFWEWNAYPRDPIEYGADLGPFGRKWKTKSLVITFWWDSSFCGASTRKICLINAVNNKIKTHLKLKNKNWISIWIWNSPNRTKNMYNSYCFKKKQTHFLICWILFGPWWLQI